MLAKQGTVTESGAYGNGRRRSRGREPEKSYRITTIATIHAHNATTRYAYPTGLISFELLENCRNTKCITSFCGNIISQDIAAFSLSPEGSLPEVAQPIADPEERAQAVQGLVKRLLDEGFTPSRIAILSPWRSSNSQSALSKLSKIHGYALRGDEDSLERSVAGKIIWVSTVKSFKGMEADCVILADAPSPATTPHFTTSDFYVASSRAKHRLFIFPDSVEAASQISLWGKGVSRLGI